MSLGMGVGRTLAGTQPLPGLEAPLRRHSLAHASRRACLIASLVSFARCVEELLAHATLAAVSKRVGFLQLFLHLASFAF